MEQVIALLTEMKKDLREDIRVIHSRIDGLQETAQANHLEIAERLPRHKAELVAMVHFEQLERAKQIGKIYAVMDDKTEECVNAVAKHEEKHHDLRKNAGFISILVGMFVALYEVIVSIFRGTGK